MKGARTLVDLLRSKQDNDKSLGQHFLINDELITLSIQYAEIVKPDHVLEIGPGPGVLTEALLMQGCRVTAIEIDEGAVKHLQSIFASEIASGQLNLLSGDALQVKWPTSISKVVANIPYQISSPLVELLTKYLRDDEVKLLQKVVLLVQEEFAERLVMEYESDVGSLGMTALLDWQSEMLQKVPPHNFSPNPKVNSCFIEMKPSHEQFECDKRLVKQVIHQAFKQRRKKIRTSLKSIPRRLNRVPNWYSARWKLAISSLADDERMNARPEEFDFDDWIEFCQDLEKIQDKS
ncbi:MAG: ribosomal RNA small subunit methyltransferase A [Euryarchaeota archaeon]|jgi:16S rRNA (adenine1518-N6/adenine1519-N6)-dimethyltransferase|nr:ribosomal RNA small subunit methyltransferase A [Euryarchaeota archaeon]|tara:strand:- start:11488 stop:12363 length:876 start_codon:yes stop_codon:yes gene_type:complete